MISSRVGVVFLVVLCYVDVSVASESFNYPIPPSYDVLVRAAKQKSIITNILQNVKYPASAQTIASGVVPSAWSPNVAGRINPVGYFDNTALTLEYFYGLAGPALGLPPAAVAGRPYVSEVVIKLLQSENNVVSYDADFILDVFGADGKTPMPGATYNMTHFGYFAFDKNDQVCGYESTFRHLGLSTPISPAVIPAVCGGIQALCTGSNQQYQNMSDCISFLTSSVPLGTWDEADQNNVACRQLHLVLAPLNPVVHCPHTGKTGGGMCVDKTSASYYQFDYQSCKDNHAGFHWPWWGGSGSTDSVNVNGDSATQSVAVNTPSVPNASTNSYNTMGLIIGLSVGIPIFILGLMMIAVYIRYQKSSSTETSTTRPDQQAVLA